MSKCILAKWGVTAEVGDKIEFEMPPFCSGDYIYEVTMDNKGRLVLEDCPSKIFEGCRDYEIIKK